MTARARPAITVAVCTRDRPDQLKEALEAVLRGLEPGQSVLVIDSASTDDRTAAVARSLDIEVVRVEEPGLSRARNAAIECVRTELIAFTDDDCLPRPGWLTPLSDAFSDRRVGFVTGSVVSDLGRGPRISVMDHSEPRRFSGQRTTRGIGHGANMAFRMATLREIGGFDQHLGAGTRLCSGEDSDMFLRCLMAEWTGVFEPRSVVVHRQWRTTIATLARVRYGHGLGAGAVYAKRARALRNSSWRQLGHVLGLRGLAPVAKSLVSRPPSQTVAHAAHAFGYFRGYVTGLAMPITREAGVFAPSRGETLALVSPVAGGTRPTDGLSGNEGDVSSGGGTSADREASRP